jgi:hypothetical protein
MLENQHNSRCESIITLLPSDVATDTETTVNLQSLLDHYWAETSMTKHCFGCNAQYNHDACAGVCSGNSEHVEKTTLSVAAPVLIINVNRATVSATSGTTQREYELSVPDHIYVTTSIQLKAEEGSIAITNETIGEKAIYVTGRAHFCCAARILKLVSYSSLSLQWSEQRNL